MIVVVDVVETRRTSKRMRTRWIGIFGVALRRMTCQMIVVAGVVQDLFEENVCIVIIT